jgi:hypothetical protein
MNDEFERRELEQRVHRELRSLQEPEAPETLLHRVMLAVHQRARQPWWRRAWRRWPLWARLVSLAAMFACAAAISVAFDLGVQRAGDFGQGLSGKATPWLEPLRPFYGTLMALLGAIVTVVKAVGTPFWLALAGLVGFAYAIFIGLGTVCVRLAYSRT